MTKQIPDVCIYYVQVAINLILILILKKKIGKKIYTVLKQIPLFDWKFNYCHFDTKYDHIAQ